MVGCAIRGEKEKPKWLSRLLHRNFFGSCFDHRELRKNENNVFCIDCSLRCCKHCITSSGHCLHRRLQICKYVYQDVVRIQEMQKHLDCSKIQTYKINGAFAVHLNPRPSTKDSKDSKQTKTKGGAACETCGRYMQDLPNRFCSIACKVSIVSSKSKDQSHNKVVSIPIPELSLKENSNPEGSTSSISLAESSEEFQAWVSSALKPRKQLHKRKGIPSRAPLC